jgi:formamidopyrimidine-DNA glycosylase
LPELPEVEVICRRLKLDLTGRTIASIHLLTPSTLRRTSEDDLVSLAGSRIRDVRRRGKLIIIETDSRFSMVFHLKMTGQLVAGAGKTAGKHCRAVIDCRGEDGSMLHLHFNDMRRFGYLLLVPSGLEEETPPVSSLGPDALTVTPEELAGITGTSRRQIKALLLDQTRLAGLGNIYVDETLHLSGIHPSAPASGISRDRIVKMHSVMCDVLQRAISRGGSSVRDYVDSEGRSGSFQREHTVYGRAGEPCTGCSTPIRREVIAGRGTHFCPDCQRKRPRRKSRSRTSSGR